MPDTQIRYKAGKLSFLLVCLFLCVACGREKAVFEAGEKSGDASFKEETAETMEDTEKAAEEESEPAGEISGSRKININTANAQQLMTLPGIGKVRAAAIIEYRQSEGDFERIEDIMNVKGIKTGVFSKINSLICVK